MPTPVRRRVDQLEVQRFAWVCGMLAAVLVEFVWIVIIGKQAGWWFWASFLPVLVVCSYGLNRWTHKVAAEQRRMYQEWTEDMEEFFSASRRAQREKGSTS